MGNQIGGNIIRAFEAGRRAKQEKEQQNILEQERKLKLDLLEDQKKQIKRQQQIEKFQLLKGTQGEVTPGTPPWQPEPSELGGQMAQLPGLNPVEAQHAPVEIEPGFSLTPPNRSETQQMGLEQLMQGLAVKRREEEQKPYTLGAGQVRIQGGQPVASAPHKPDNEKQPSIVQEYLFQVQEDVRAGRKPPTFDEYQTRDANRKANRTTIINQLDKLLTPQEAATLQVPYGTTREEARGKMPFKDSQGPTANYATRIEQANKTFAEIENEISGMGYLGQKYQEMAPNALQTATGQMFDQAKRNFINAVLRRESGAVISPTEFTEGEKQYFPKPGDSAEVLAQKKANRDLVQANFIREAGNAYQPPGSLTPPPSGSPQTIPEGTVRRNKNTGEEQVFTGGQWQIR